MDEKELAQLEELARQATPGPWICDEDIPPENSRVCRAGPDGRCVACLILVGDYDYEKEEWAEGVPEQTRADGRFMAAAREAVPALIAEVRRLHGLVDADHGGRIPTRPLSDFVGALPPLPDGELAEDLLARVHGERDS